MKYSFNALPLTLHARPGFCKFTVPLLLLLFLLGPFTMWAQNIGSSRFANELEYIQVSNGSDLDITDDFSIEAWIYLEELPPSDEVSTIIDNVSLGGGGLKWVINSDGKLELSYPYLTVLTNTFRSNSSIPTGQWVHIALTWDYNFPPADDFGKMYINGVLDAQQSFLNGISSSSARMYIGGLPDGIVSTPEAGLRGRIGELKIWNSTRSETEVAADRFAACVTPSSLKLYYNFGTLDGGNIRNLANPGTFSGIRNGVNGSFDFTLTQLATPTIFYVDANVGQSGVGVTWATAFKTLDEALVAAHEYCTAITNIHVAQGTYKPTRQLFDGNSEFSTGDLRDRAFHIRRSGLHLYGGFPTGGANTSNPTLYPTILSGDFNGNDSASGSGTTLTLSGNAENAYHVLVSNGDDTSVEGFIIEGGNANGGSVLTVNGQSIHREHGGGAYHVARLLRSTLRHNASRGDGAGLYNARRLNALESVVFSHNQTAGRGAGLFYNNGSNDVSPIVLQQVSWIGNKAASAGGGAFLSNVQAPISISGGLFKDNAALQGAGLHVSAGTGSHLLDKCVFAGNISSTGNGGGMASSQTTLEARNCVFTGNTANQGGGLWLFDGQHSILNNTFHGNTATTNGSAIHNTGNANSVVNSIIWGNTGSSSLFNTAGSTLLVTYSVTQDALYPGTGNTTSNPNFIAPNTPSGSDGIWRTNDDGLRLDCQSSAFNTAQTLGSITTDIRGDSRPKFGQPDMGAYESERDLIPTAIVLSGETIAVNYLEHMATGGTTFQWSGGDTPNQAANVFRTSGTYRVTVTNSFGCTNIDSVMLTILPCPGSTIYVDSSVVVSGNGTSWATAFKTLDEALVVAWRCDAVERIEVARGTYISNRFPFRPNGLYISLDGHHHDRMFHLPSGVTLLGGYPSQGGMRNVSTNRTILQGNGSGRVLLALAANNTRLDGFTIQQGRALSGAVGLMVGAVSVPRQDGGGLYCLNSSLIVNNCTFKDNLAIFGGGLYSLGGTPLYENCTFKQNIAGDNGGGTYVEGDDVRFLNSVWYGNQANQADVNNQAGGVLALGRPNFIHCTLTGNSRFNLIGSPNVRNSIIFNADGIGKTLAPDRISNSIVTGVAASDGNTSYASTNPQFVNPNNPAGPDGLDRTADDGLSLRENSPAINAGAAVDGSLTDITGTTRGGLPDIGAYEAINACTFSTPKTIFVKHNANGSADGSSWANAYPSLNTALQQACNGDQIWVAAGVYKPESYPAYCDDCTDTREFAFALKNGVKVYGGFVGTESSLAMRNIAANPTMLSGDIGTAGNASDNCYHVVLSLNDGPETLLDGFIVTNGNANGTFIKMDTFPNFEFPELDQIIQTETSKQSNAESIGVSHGDGGGLYWHTSRAIVRNCTLTNNKARFDGGGWSIQRGVATSENNDIVGNIASVGGGIYANEAYLGLEKTRVLANSTIADTIAPLPCPFPDPSFCGDPAPPTITLRGTGGVRLRLGNGHFRNSFFVNNIGAGVDISDTRTSIGFTNCIFHNNSFGGLQSANSSPVLLNCTAAKNKLHFGGFASNDYIPRAFIANSIIWTNEGESGLDFGGVSGFRYEVRNSIWQGAGGELNSNPVGGYTNANNLEADPIYSNFANPAGPDNVFGTADDGLIPSANGLAYELGEATVSTFYLGTLTAPTQDVTGTLRAGRPDAGAYEAFVRCPPGRTPVRHYVNHLAAGSNDGTSWANAFTSVSTALEQACTGDEIWVAQGTYKPTFDRFGNVSPGDPRDKTFAIRTEGVQVYGGFVGNETQREQRNWISNPTILSGDLGTAGDHDDNTYHVVYIDPRLDSITTATVLDGFSIRDGNASGAADAQKNGGGIYNAASATRSSPTIANCTIIQNRARAYGMGMYNASSNGGVSSPVLNNCNFIENTPLFDHDGTFGSGLYNLAQSGGVSSPVLSNCTFSSNHARWGGGISNIADGGTSSPVLSNCSFLNNSSVWDGAGLYNIALNGGVGSPLLTNCVFFDNGGGCLAGSGMYNRQEDMGSMVNSVLINCTFTKNHARASGGGLLNHSGTLSLINCIVWGNTSDDGFPNIRNLSGTLNIAHSIIQGSGGSSNWNGDFGQNNGNNLDVDPLFVDPLNANGPDNQARTSDDGLRLNADSPARNVGNAAVNVPLDILGNARGAQYDMGAYEVFCVDTLYVDASVANSGTGQSWAKAFKTLEGALSAACAPQVILVAAGTYQPTRTLGGSNDPRDQSFEIKRGIQVFGGYPNGGGSRDVTAHATILSGDLNGNDQVTGCGANLSISGNAENVYHVVVLAYDDFNSSLPYARLDGLYIRGGFANGTGEASSGIYPRYHGGGVFANYAHATLSKVVIEGNAASAWGGGLHGYASPLELIDCVVQNNMANNGGGLGHFFQASNVQAHKFKISGSTFACNKSTEFGGALHSERGHSFEIDQSVFEFNNSSTQTGGVSIFSESEQLGSTITNSVFFANSALNNGGGARLTGQSGHTLRNTVFVQNTVSSSGAFGAGLRMDPSSSNQVVNSIINCTFFGNDNQNFYGGGLSVSSASFNIVNTVFDQNTGGGSNNFAPDIHNSNNTAAIQISYSALQLADASQYGVGTFNQMTIGNGMLYGQSELFLNSGAPKGADNRFLTNDDGLSLKANSPAINAGLNSANTTLLDIANNPRISNDTIDMGAYEYKGTVTPPVCPSFSGAPAAVSITNSVCSAACMLTGGTIPCPSGSTLQYRVNGSAWSATLPVYDQDGPPQIIKTRCSCDSDSTMVSDSSMVSTQPGVCSPPVLTCPNNITVNNDLNQCGARVTYTAPVVSGDCSDANVVQTEGLASGATFPVGTTTNTFIATAVNGQKDTCSFTVTVTDNQAPTITCPANISVNNDAGQCSAVVTYTAPVGSDNCPGATTTQTAGLPSGSAFPVGTTTNTFVVTAANGQSATCSFTVTVTDNQAPTITCPANISVNNDAGQCSAVVTYTAPVGSDNCPGATTTQTAGLPSGSAFPVGTTTNTFVVTAANGQSATCSFTVTVTDNQAPTITCPANISVNNDVNQCSAVVTYTAPVGSDNCPGATTTQTAGLPSGSAFPIGTTTNTFVVTAANGQTATCSFTVTVTDNQAPTITCPANVSVNNDLDQCSAVVTYTAPVGSDNCSGATTTQTAGLPSGSAFPVGTTTNTFVVTAANGQSATCSFTVTVTDNQAPTISCPGNISVNNDLDQCSAVVTYTTPVGSDNCPGATTTQTAGLPSGSAFPVGTTTNTFVVTAANGQSATCSFTVTVTDNQAPTITCPANISVNNDLHQCSAVVTYTAPVGSDNCPGATTTQTAGLPSGSAFPVGTTTNTFVVTAANGQSATCSFTVTVTDNQAPTITCPANISVNNDAGQCSAIVTYIAPVGSDNCAGATTTQIAGLASGAAFPVGVTTNTFQVRAANGQMATCSFTVTVTDNEAPTASCQAPFTITLNSQSQYILTVVEVNNGSSDNCGIVQYSLSKTNFTCADIGKKQVTLIVSDAAGLKDSCTVEITVQGSSACEISIGNAGGPSIADPCQCSTVPLHFDEEIVITGNSNGESWILVSNTGLIDPNTALPYPVGTPFVSIGNNQYSLVGRHQSGVGYAVRAASSFYPDTLSIDNVCYYPALSITGLPALVSPSAAPFVVTGTAANNAVGTGNFTLNGNAQAGAGPSPTALTINPASLPLGTNTLSYTFDAGTAGSKNVNDPGCVTTIQRSFQVAHCGCQDVTVSLDANCQFVLTGNLVSDANCGGGTVRVMDNNPSNGNIIDCAGVWTYGLFDAFGNIICWGKVTAEDKRAPELVCAPADITLDCYDVSYVLNNPLTIGNRDTTNSPRPAATGNQTINNAEGVAKGAQKGDNCTNTLAPPNLLADNIKNLGYAYFRDNCRDCGCRINLKWTDKVVYYSCTDIEFTRDGYYAKIEREWVATDCNGMSSSDKQDIYFKRPSIKSFTFANTTRTGVTTKTGVAAGAPNYDWVVEYNSCTPDKSLIAKGDVTPRHCSWFNTASNPRCLYIDQVECNYSVTIKDTEFPICGGKGVKIDREMFVFDWCKGGIVDTIHILIKIGDFEAPKLEYAHHAPFDISTGPMDCTAAIPTTAAGIKAQFGVTIKDNCTLGNISVSVKTKDRYVKGLLVAENVWEKVDYAVMNGMMIGLPVGTHRLIIDASDGCYNAKRDSFNFEVKDKIAPVMKCDDDLHITLSNANGYTNGYAQVSAADIDEGSWDNCKLAWIAVRRNVPASCEASFVQKGYDSNGNNKLDAAPFDAPKDAPAGFDWSTVDGVDINGDGDISDFGEFVATKGGKKMTPLLDLVEFFCCDLSERVTVELWGADTADDPKTLADETNYNYCWMDLLIEDKVTPTCIAPWDVTIDCDDKNIALIDDKVASSKIWGDVTITTGNDCAALDTVYSVEKSLKCGYGKIVRKWTLSKQTAKGPITITCSQTIWIRPIHQYDICFPKDVSTDCKTPTADTVIVDELACDLLAVNVSDKRYDATEDECYKIFRTYTVINWCAYDDKCGDPMAEGNVFVVDRSLWGNNGKNPIYVLTRDRDRDLNEEFWLSKDLTVNNGDDIYVRGDGNYGGLTLGANVTVSAKLMPECRAYDLPTDHFQDWEYHHSFMYTQIIKVYDDVRPEVTGIRDTFCTSPTACTANITKVVTLKDNCSDKVSLETQYLMIAPFQTTAAGSMIPYSTPRWSTKDLGNGNFQISVSNLPEGTHDLIVVGRDECGNLSLATRIPFVVKDCKAPAPICINGLSTGIMPDGNGGGMMTVWASDFVASKIYDCNGQGSETKDGLKLVTKYSVNRVKEPVNPNQTSISVNCADLELGFILVELHAWDEAGNHDFCITFVEVQDNNKVCPAPADKIGIAGTIATEGAGNLQGVTVTLSGGGTQNDMTGVDGNYEFVNLARGGDFTVTPQLDKNHLNGVSTFDLVLIQKHILGVQALNSPYKMIAADANNSKTITTLDMIQIRKLILNIDTHFANNTSWRFVDAAYRFPNANNPWVGTFPEVVSVNDLTGNIKANFVAIKVGDVNASASINSAASAEIRTNNNFELKTQEQSLKSGNEYKVTFTATDLKSIQGYQFALNLDQSKVELLDMEYGVAKAENFGVFKNEGLITTSWNSRYEPGALFTLVLRAKADAKLSNTLSLNRVVSPEAYDQNNENLGIALNFEGIQASEAYELKQNTPNPFSNETVIGFTLPKALKGTLTIRDVKGALIYKAEGNYAKGNNQVSLKKSQLGASGVLYYTLETTDFTATKKMVILE